MLGSLTPHRLALVILSNFEVLIIVLLIYLKDDLSILIHLLVGLCNYESVFALATEHKKFDSFFLCAFRFTVISNHKSTLGKLGFRSKDIFGSLWVI